MPGIVTSFSRWIYEKIVGDGFGRLFDHNMFAKERPRDLNRFDTSPTASEMAFGIVRNPPSSSFHRNSVDSSLSTPPGLTRCNSLVTCGSAPPTPSSTFSPSAVPFRPTLPKRRRRPSGEAYEPIFYCERELLAAAKELYPEAYPYDEATAPEAAEYPSAKTHWVGYAANAPECALAPSHEMVGEGSYRISKNASLEQLLDSFSANQWPMGPLIVTFAGPDRMVPGHNFTYQKLNRALYKRSTAATTKETALHSYTVEKDEEGTEVQRGFPIPPGNPASPSVIPGHMGADWHSPLPRVKEWDLVHNKGCPGLSGAQLARMASAQLARMARPRPQQPQQPPNGMARPRPQQPQQPPNVPSNHVPPKNVPPKNVPPKNVPPKNVPTNNVPNNNIPNIHVPNKNVPLHSILKNGMGTHRSTRVRPQAHVRFADYPHVRFLEQPQIPEEPQDDSEEDAGPPQDIMVERAVKRDPKPAPKRKFVATRPKAIATRPKAVRTVTVQRVTVQRITAQRVTIQRVQPQLISQKPDACNRDEVPSPKVYNTAARYHPGAMVRIGNPDEENLDDALESCD